MLPWSTQTKPAVDQPTTVNRALQPIVILLLHNLPLYLPLLANLPTSNLQYLISPSVSPQCTVSNLRPKPGYCYCYQLPVTQFS